MPGQVPGSGRGPIFQPPRIPPGGGDPRSTSRYGQGRPTRDTGTTAEQVALGLVGGAPAGPTGPDYTITLNSPVSGTLAQTLSFAVNVTPVSSDASAMTVMFQTASDAAFTTDVSTTALTGQASGAAVSTTLGPFTDGLIRHVRVRAGFGASWSAWSSIWVFVSTESRDATEYSLFNVGVATVADDEGVEYSLFNVGVHTTLSGDATEYLYFGDVNTDAPTPWLWALMPHSGRPGDGISVYGHGLGATQATYSGELQMLIDGTWGPISVVAWTVEAASVDAYTEDRAILPYEGRIDPEHGVIDTVIPVDAHNPGHQLRVRTTT